jgi:predicted transcriptional regulator
VVVEPRFLEVSVMSMERQMTVTATDIMRAIAGAQFPADKEGLVLQARLNEASAEVIEAIDRLDRSQFHSRDEVRALFE